MSYRDPNQEWIETITCMVIAAFFFWVIFFLTRDVIMATPL
jgi:hypothetical protein